MLASSFAQNWTMFALNVVGTVTALLLILWIWVWPALKRRSFYEAALPLVIFNIFRAVGAGFLIDGIVNPDIPAGFATPTAIGDLIAAGLAAVTAVGLARKASWGIGVAWVFNIVGLVDLLNALVQAARLEMDPAVLGSMYLVVAVNVPALILTHVVLFVLLIRNRRGRLAP